MSVTYVMRFVCVSLGLAYTTQLIRSHVSVYPYV